MLVWSEKGGLLHRVACCLFSLLMIKTVSLDISTICSVMDLPRMCLWYYSWWSAMNLVSVWTDSQPCLQNWSKAYLYWSPNYLILRAWKFAINCLAFGQWDTNQSNNNWPYCSPGGSLKSPNLLSHLATLIEIWIHQITMNPKFGFCCGVNLHKCLLHEMRQPFSAKSTEVAWPLY